MLAKLVDTALRQRLLVLIAALGLAAYQATLWLERWLLRPYTRID